MTEKTFTINASATTQKIRKSLRVNGRETNVSLCSLVVGMIEELSDGKQSQFMLQCVGDFAAAMRIDAYSPSDALAKLVATGMSASLAVELSVVHTYASRKV